MELTLRGVTDTTHQQSVVPIYFIHSIKQPFCQQPGCWCHTNPAQIARLLRAVQAGPFLLAQADNFTTGAEHSQGGV